MTTGEKVKQGILAAACFVGPLYLLTAAPEMVSVPGWRTVYSFLGWLFAAGIAWVLLELWRSQLPTDAKLYWTVLGLIVMPVVLPYFWYSHLSGLKRKPPNLPPPHNADCPPVPTDSSASATRLRSTCAAELNR